VKRLFALGKEVPFYLISLTQVVQPNIPDNMRVPLLGKLFSEVPSLIGDMNDSDVVQIIENPPLGAITFRLLLDLRQIQCLLKNISYDILLQLTLSLAPINSISPNQQLDYLEKIQKVFQTWSLESIEEYSKEIVSTPFHLQKQRLLEFDPDVIPDVIHFVIEFLKLPFDEIQVFKSWIQNLNENNLIILVNLLQMDANILIDIKKRLTDEEYVKNFLSVGQKRSRQGDMIESQKTIIDESMENLEISKMAPQSKRMNKYQNVNSMEEPVVFDTQNGTTYGINDPMTFYDELSYFPMNDNEHMENINMFTPMTFEENKTNTIIMNQPVEPQNNVTNEPKPKTTKRKNVKKKDNNISSS